MNILPEHLGGHANKTHLFPEVFEFLKNKFNIRSMVDVGCGPGGMVEYARSQKIHAIGIDGDWSINRNIDVIIHDFTKSNIDVEEFDLCWSVEFLEHVEEKYMKNYFSVFDKCKYIMCTAAPPGTPGHHHVNCQTKEYWIEKFNQHDFLFDETTTNEVKNLKYQKKKDFIKQNGMFFVKKV